MRYRCRRFVSGYGAEIYEEEERTELGDGSFEIRSRWVPSCDEIFHDTVKFKTPSSYRSEWLRTSRLTVRDPDPK